MTKPPTDAETEDALMTLDRWAHHGIPDLLPIIATLRAALASLRSDVAAKDAEIERLNAEQDDYAETAAFCGKRAEEARAALAAAENRGFREAGEWLAKNKVEPGVYGYGEQRRHSPANAIIAEADRREGK